MRVKGSVILARQAFVEQHFGKESWVKVLCSLDVRDQQVLRGHVLHTEWYPFELEEHVDKAIAGVLGKGEPGVFESIGRKSARENLGGVHRAFLSPGDPQSFLSKSGMIYNFYYNSGRREYQPTGPCSGVLTTFDAETSSEIDCLTVIGWYREALEMCGVRDVEIVEETCRARGGPHCRYRFSWRT